jgi:hypothetical protein
MRKILPKKKQTFFAFQIAKVTRIYFGKFEKEIVNTCQHLNCLAQILLYVMLNFLLYVKKTWIV